MRKEYKPLSLSGLLYTGSVFLLFIFLLFPHAVAAASDSLWVSPMQEHSSGDENTSVHWFYGQGRKYYLFLPSYSPAEGLALWFTGEESLTVEQDGRVIQSGDSANWLVPGAEYTLKGKRKSFTLVVMQSADIPALMINTASGSLEYIHKNKKNKETGSLTMMMQDGTIAYDGALDQIKGRGNASFNYAKKSYQIKLETKTSLCGMEKSKTWLLIANQHDNSLLRNHLSFSLAREVGLSFTPQSQAVDLYINGNYLGSYLLCEKVQVAAGRVEITDLEEQNEELNITAPEDSKAFGRKGYKKGTQKGVVLSEEPEDITGGYLLELEYANRYPDEASGFVTQKGQSVVVKSPEYAGQEEISYISGLVQDFENALFSKSGWDSQTGKHYSEFIDMASFARKYILEEYSKNYDANRSSQFFYKDKDSVSELIHAGPVWDYDSAYGNYGSNEASPTLKPRGLFVATNRSRPYFWYPKLCEKKDFMDLVKKIWQEEYLPVLRTMLLGTGEREGVLSIEQMAAPIRDSADMNFMRWRIFNYEKRAARTGGNYQKNLDYLNNFLTRRAAYLCELWGGEFDAPGL